MIDKQTILVVEDEPTILNFMRSILTANQYRVISSINGRDALTLSASYCPDLMLLDLGLPDMDGLEVIREIRAWSSMPIIVVSARSLESEKVNALDAGADDYVTKPFGTSELLARIRAALRHAQYALSSNAGGASSYSVYDLSIDFVKRVLTVGGREVHLTPIEYKIVTLLSQNPGRVLTYDTIIQQIWGPYATHENQILRVNMANIRRKIEKNPAEPVYILTEVGVGYRMVEEG